MKRHFLTLLFLLCLAAGTSQTLKSPSEFLGYELGSQFTRHHEVIAYFNYVASTLPGQVQLQPYGYTNERRPLMIALLSSLENMGRLESIRPGCRPRRRPPEP